MKRNTGATTETAEAGNELVAALGFQPAPGADPIEIDLPSEPVAGSTKSDADTVSQQPSAEVAESTMTPPKGKGKGPQSFAPSPESTQPTEPTVPDSSAPDSKSNTVPETDARDPSVIDTANATFAAETGPIAGYRSADTASPGPQPVPIDPMGQFGVTRNLDDQPSASAVGDYSYSTGVASPIASPAQVRAEVGVKPGVPNPEETTIIGTNNAGVGGGVASQASNVETMTSKASDLMAKMPQLIEKGFYDRSRRVRARKVRRVIRHIDPWSVLTFSVLFHLFVFASMLLASVLVWNAAEAAGTIENLEKFIIELGDFKEYDIKEDVVFRAAMIIAGILTLASSVVVVLLTVVFNLISDLIGGVRVTVVEEEVVRVRRNPNPVAARSENL